MSVIIRKQGQYRIVEPYQHQFIARAKGRWYGSTLLQVLTTEFLGYTETYYRLAINNGLIKVNNLAVSVDYIIEPHDLILHEMHRHESPVGVVDIKIVYEDDLVLVVDKPPSLPVHPCGRFYHNSLEKILNLEYEKSPLYLVHRLDRLTSGVVIFSKTKENARNLQDDMKDESTQKVYLAKVEGVFPEEVTVDQPIVIVPNKSAVNYVDPTGIEAKTHFELLWTNGATSVVKCYPETGRTHQIRVHLSWLGHPIINDPLYNISNYVPYLDKVGNTMEIFDQHLKELDPNDLVLASLCPDCVSPYPLPKLENMLIYLHALSYKIGEHQFTTDPPEWSIDDRECI
eukprot:TRINITY_DN9331_c0_g2_i1.p1 TRINITY_DN9331_c0_g2~~TRINITY_DN9331_c0_g2_i1.p1  ORF type:complete len:343 (+),score=65.23 TRINITY_DN9331_c0_g2_i1:95-1123(+)